LASRAPRSTGTPRPRHPCCRRAQIATEQYADRMSWNVHLRCVAYPNIDATTAGVSLKPIINARRTTITPLTKALYSFEEYNRVDWRSTLRYAVAAKQTQTHEIIRSRRLVNNIGTAFGTARLIASTLRADAASLFRSVGPIHHEEVWSSSSKRKLRLIHLLNGDSKSLCGTDVDDLRTTALRHKRSFRKIGV
jgi:hypothetical protein